MNQQLNTKSGFQAPLYQMFRNVTTQYDLMNRVLTLGFDQKWRRIAVKKCTAVNSGFIMDLCCGTGDLAREMLRLAPGLKSVVLVDFSGEMLRTARLKLLKSGFNGKVVLIQADAAHLPFRDGLFSSIGIGFGFRNLTYKQSRKDMYLKEIHRVLRYGGKFVFVETSQPENNLFRRIYHLYMGYVVPFIGDTLFRNKGAYTYLGTSARYFFKPEEVMSMLESAGFGNTVWQKLMGGIISVVETNRPQEGETGY